MAQERTSLAEGNPSAGGSGGGGVPQTPAPSSDYKPTGTYTPGARRPGYDPFGIAPRDIPPYQPPAPGGDPTTDPPTTDPPPGGGGGGGGGGGSRGGGGKKPENFTFRMPSTPSDASLIRGRWDAAERMRPDIDEANIDRINYYDRTYLTDLATQQIEAARQQYNNQINQAMDTQAAGLNRALADAQGQFRNQQNQVAANEQQAMNNAALYAQARGDQGGIGLAQYNSIQNTAAKNKLAVSQAQTKLATDTARQISDLRAQGEFEKADKMLELTQTYLSELRQIEEYAANYNLSVDQMNTAIAEWEAEFNRSTAQYMASWEQAMMQYTGGFADGTTTYQAQQETQQAQAQLAMSLIQSGVNPNKLSSTQLAALQQVYGMSRSQIIALYKQSKKKK